MKLKLSLLLLFFLMFGSTRAGLSSFLRKILKPVFSISEAVIGKVVAESIKLQQGVYRSDPEATQWVQTIFKKVVHEGRKEYRGSFDITILKARHVNAMATPGGHIFVTYGLLQKITDTTIAYLKEKVKAGCNAVQVFDSWGGMLSPVDYQEFSWQYIQQIIDALKDDAPVIAFGKGCWFALGEMAKSGASALGVDWTCSARNARYLTGGHITLQGNFDPTRLFSPASEIKKMVHQMINDFGKDKYIVNLGHGILPNIPLDHAKAFIDAVKEYNT